MGWASLAGHSTFVGGRSHMGQGHTDSLGCMCAHACEHTHTRTLVLCARILPSASQNMTHFPQPGCAGSAQSLRLSLEQAGPGSFLVCSQEPHAQQLNCGFLGGSGVAGRELLVPGAQRGFQEARDPPRRQQRGSGGCTCFSCFRETRQFSR